MDAQVEGKDICRERALGPRTARELETMRAMLGMYCEHHHGSGGTLCGDCAEILAYARVRLTRCPYGEGKPTCANCPIHCYQERMRARVKAVMRFAGPRMLLRHPILALLHKLDGRKRPAPPGKTSARR